MLAFLPWIAALVFVWVLQSIFVFFQARAFARRITQLRHEGRLAIGLGRSRFRVRLFAIVVVNREDRVVKVETLSGWSVFARPRLLPRYAGLPVAELPQAVRAQKASRQLQGAIDQAVKALTQPEPSTEGAVMPTRQDAADTADPPEEEEGGVAIADPI